MILKASELRIGNWYKQDDLAGRYAQITAKDIWELDSDPLDDFYQDILFTPNIVENLSLLNIKPFITKIGYCHFDKDENLYFIRYIGIKIYTVHQLQNVHFAFYGKEFIIEL